MKAKLIKKMFILFILISIVASLIQIGIRINAEKKQDTVDIAADFYTFKTFSNAYGKTVFDAIKELKENGLTSIAVPEQCINDIVTNGEAVQYTGSDLINNTNPELFENFNFKNLQIKPFYTVIITKNKSLAERIQENILQSTNLVVGNNNLYAAIIHSDPVDAANFGIGFNENTISKFKSMGLNIVLRPRYAPGNTNLKSLENTIKKFDIHTVMFYGTVIYGAGGNGTKALAEFFKRNSIVTYIIELPIQKGIYSQEGLPQLIKETGYYVARVYSIYPAEQLKLTPIQIFNRWFRSISDRNIRVIYVKPIIDSGKSYEENMAVNDYYINKFYNLWKSKGMKFGIPHPMPAVDIHMTTIFLILLGIIALFIIYINTLFSENVRYSIIEFTILALLGAALVFVSKSLSEKLAALSAAVLITGVVSLFLLHYIKKLYGKQISIYKILKNGIILSLITFFFSLLGGIWIGALLSSSPYLLNLDMFRGVKVLYLSPFIFLVINYLYVFGTDFNDKNVPKEKYDLFEEFKNAWNMPVKWGHIGILIIIAGIFLIYLLRSGNTGVSISSLELQFRAFLEHRIVARPRFKEFLIGYPGIFLTVLFAYLMRKKWILVFSIASLMGAISIVDTFSHLRETFLISLYRSLYGIAAGIPIAVLTVLILYIPIKKILKNEK